MEYKLDIEDVRFTLFDFLNAGQLASISRFEGQSVEMYQQIIDEALKFL